MKFFVGGTAHHLNNSLTTTPRAHQDGVEVSPGMHLLASVADTAGSPAHILPLVPRELLQLVCELASLGRAAVPQQDVSAGSTVRPAHQLKRRLAPSVVQQIADSYSPLKTKSAISGAPNPCPMGLKIREKIRLC